MLRRAVPVLLFSLSCLIPVSTASADPVRITSGKVVVTGIVRIGSLDIMGTQGFSLSGVVDNASTAFWTCSVPECVEGTPLDLFLHLGGPTLLDARATLNGVTYTDVDTFDGSAYTNMFFRGTAFAPALGDAPTTVTAPFTFDGGFFLAGTGLLRDLTGAGTATLSLSPYGFGQSGFPPSWFIDRIEYDFTDPAPVPEPATMTLVGTALAAAYLTRARRRARRFTDPD